MPAHAGQFPKATKVTQDSFFNHNGSAKSTVKAKRVDWNLSSGWHPKRAKGWNKGVHYKIHELVGTDGKKYKVRYYDDANFEDVTGFHAHVADSDRNIKAQKIFNRAEAAFSSENKDKIHSATAKTGGHISKIEYDELELLMRVTFEDGTICIFDKIPHTVAGTLLHAMEQDTKAGYYDIDTYGWSKAGKEKHLVGVLFWDYVRIRGRRHGAKYPFEYEKHASYRASGSNKRYMIKNASVEDLEAIFPDKKELTLQATLHPFTDNATLSVTLSPEEYDKYIQKMRDKLMMESDPDDLGSNEESLGMYDDTNDTFDTSSGLYEEQRFFDNDLKQLGISVTSTNKEKMSKPVDFIEENSRREYAEKIHTAMQGMWNDFLKRDDVSAAMNAWQGAYSQRDLFNKLVKEFGDDKIDAIIDKRTGQLKTAALSDDRIARLARAVFGKQGYRMHYVGEHQNQYAQRTVGRPWTPDELRALLVTREDGLDLGGSPVYRKYIETKNWEGALNYLKSMKRAEVEVVYPNGEKIRRQKAGPNDFIQYK